MKKIRITERQAKLLRLDEELKHNRVDRTFKKEVGNLKEDGVSIPKLNPKIMNRGPIKEHHNIPEETVKLIKYLYRKSDEFSPYWAEYGLSYEDICDALKAKDMLVSKDGHYELSAKLGNAQQAKAKLEAELTALTSNNVPDAPVDVEEDGGYPAGAANHPDAPWNQPDEPIQDNVLDLVAFNNDIAIFLGPKGDLVAYNHYDNHNHDGGRDEESITRFVNDNIDELPVSVGVEAFENEEDNPKYKGLVRVDDKLRAHLVSLYDKDKQVVHALTKLQETSDHEIAKKKLSMGIPTKPVRTGKSKEDIAAKLKAIRDKELANRAGRDEIAEEVEEIDEMTAAGGAGGGQTNAGQYVAPMGMVKKPVGAPITVAEEEIAEEETIDEVTNTASSGQYDTPGLKGIKRDGTYTKAPKTKAEKSTQYPNGTFVKIDKCTKLNNNKKAQNGGCNQGGDGGVVKQTKSKSTVISPSLDENTILEMISNETNKSISEIKEIINRKK